MWTDLKILSCVHLKRNLFHVDPHMYAWLCVQTMIWASSEVDSLTYLMVLMVLNAL